MANLAINAGPGLTTTHDALVTPGMQGLTRSGSAGVSIVPSPTLLRAPASSATIPLTSGVIGGGGGAAGAITVGNTFLNGVIGGGAAGAITIGDSHLNGVIGGGGSASSAITIGDSFLNGVIGGGGSASSAITIGESFLNGVIGGGGMSSTHVTISDPFTASTSIGVQPGAAVTNAVAPANPNSTALAAANMAAITLGMIGSTLGQSAGTSPREAQPAPGAQPANGAQPAPPAGTGSVVVGSVA